MGLGRGYRDFQFGKTASGSSGFKQKPQKSNGQSQILSSDLACSIWYHWIQLFINFPTETKSIFLRSSISGAEIMCFITNKSIPMSQTRKTEYTPCHIPQSLTGQSLSREARQLTNKLELLSLPPVYLIYPAPWSP